MYHKCGPYDSYAIPSLLKPYNTLMKRLEVFIFLEILE